MSRMSAHQDDERFSLETNFEGHEPQEFTTLQDAMNYAEDLQKPTGTIALTGTGIEEPQVVIRYEGGAIFDAT
jgi:hypothetical protein